MNFDKIDLSGKNAVVTGGSKGIGYGMAMGLATVGANLVIVSRNLQEGQAAAKDAQAKGVKAIAISCDVTKKAAVDSMVAEAARAFGQIDILINNAGMNIRKPLVDVEEEDWDTVLNTNLKGIYLVGRAVASQMIQQGKGGRIINVASVAAAVGIPNLTAYCASKGGISQMTKVWALELVEYGINVNAVGPAYIRTPMTAGWLNDKERYNWIVSMTPMGRLGEIEEWPARWSSWLRPGPLISPESPSMWTAAGPAANNLRRAGSLGSGPAA
jgi:NAD(P)-dependent dehydrogenase (short-subunit alcohol dehydrogenase family)